MDNNQLGQLIKVLELDQVHDWETIQVLWILQNNMSWRADWFGVQGFNGIMPANMTKEEVAKGHVIEYYQLGDDEDWGYLAMWLKDVVFNRGGLNLNIHSTTVWNYGDEGGPGLCIALMDEENRELIHEQIYETDEMCGDKFASTIANGLGIQVAKKVYYLYTFVM